MEAKGLQEGREGQGRDWSLDITVQGLAICSSS